MYSQPTFWTESTESLKLLYAIQGTGNGHLARAIELAPYLCEKAEVDFLISGRAAELKFPHRFSFNYHGLFFFFGKKGGVDYIRSIKSLRPLRLVKDIINCPVRQYDAIVNDFEPVSAWSARLKGRRCIAVSHQASFNSEKVPRPARRNRLFEFGMKRFAPSTDYVATHYKAYDDNIFLPVIRKELIDAPRSTGDHVVVYLPAFGDELLISHFNKVPNQKWKVFSKKTTRPYTEGQVDVYPVSRQEYSQALLNARAVVIGSGFQGTSEALYLGKKMLTIPMYDQYEQLCNAAALEEMGVPVVLKIEEGFSEVLAEWLAEPDRCNYRFQPDPAAMAERILSLVKP